MISLVIPCFNSSSYIEEHMRRLVAFLESGAGEFEVVVVDDGSSDKTPEILKTFSASDPRVHVILQAKNSGKGAAVKRGMEAARGEYIIFTDADLPYDLSALPLFVENLRAGAEVVLGARSALAGSVAGQESHRTFLSRVFATIANIVLYENVPDTQAGIKGFTREAARAIFPKVSTSRFAFDVEVIVLAQVQGFKVESSPVTLVNQSQSSVSVARDGLQMLFDLLRLFFKYKMVL